MALIFFQGWIDQENLNLSVLDFQGSLGPQVFTNLPLTVYLKTSNILLPSWDTSLDSFAVEFNQVLFSRNMCSCKSWINCKPSIFVPVISNHLTAKALL